MRKKTFIKSNFTFRIRKKDKKYIYTEGNSKRHFQFKDGVQNNWEKIKIFKIKTNKTIS